MRYWIWSSNQSMSLGGIYQINKVHFIKSPEACVYIQSRRSHESFVRIFESSWFDRRISWLAWSDFHMKGGGFLRIPVMNPTLKFIDRWMISGPEALLRWAGRRFVNLATYWHSIKVLGIADRNLSLEAFEMFSNCGWISLSVIEAIIAR